MHGAALVGDPARDLARTFAESLTWWGGPAGVGLARTGYARAQSGLDLLNNAISRLRERDRKGVKAALTAQRDDIARALAAVDSIVGDPEILIGLVNPGDAVDRRRFTGPTFVELVDARDQSSASRRAADQKMFVAVGVDAVRAGREAIDLAESEQRHASRQVDAVLTAIAFPPLPDPKIFELARTNTEQLLRLSATNPKARSMHAALDAGLNAPPAEAKLWVIYEGDEPHILTDLRWRAFAERGE